MYNHCFEDKEVGSSFASYIILDVMLHGKKTEAHSQQAPEAGGCATGDRGHIIAVTAVLNGGSSGGGRAS